MVLVIAQPSNSASNGLQHSFFTRKLKATRKTTITNWPSTIACCIKSVKQSLMNRDTQPTTSRVYAHLFIFFQKHAHLPEKHLFAILASEIASSMVYRENREAGFLAVLQSHLQHSFEDQVELNIDKV